MGLFARLFKGGGSPIKPPPPMHERISERPVSRDSAKRFPWHRPAKTRKPWGPRFTNPKKPAPKPVDSEKEQEDFFTKKGYLTRGQFRQKLGKGPEKIAGHQKRFSKEERKGLEKEQFSQKKYGIYIDKKDYNKRLRAFKKEKSWAGTSKEKREIQRKTDYLKKISGLK